MHNIPHKNDTVNFRFQAKRGTSHLHQDKRNLFAYLSLATNDDATQIPVNRLN